MMWATGLVLALLLVVQAEEALVRVKREEPRTHSDIVGRLLTNYDKDEPPLQGEGTDVRVGIYVNSIYSISAESMEYSMSFYLREAWRDGRLAYNEDIKHITLAEGKFKDIWVPDTFFRNEKKAIVHDVTVDNRLTRINRTGDVWHVTKISATFSCPMNLHKFPLDTPKCPLMIESFAHTTDEIKFSWLDTPLEIDKSLQLPHFNLKDYETHNCTQTYTAGTFPCLEIRFQFSRSICYYLVRIYFPTIFVVVVSWIQFWMPVDAAASRFVIGFLTMLAMTAITVINQMSLPHFSYVKAVDLWTQMGMLFTFLPILHFALVNMMNDSDDDDDKEGGKIRLPRGAKKAEKFDHVARIAYPVLYLLFNLIYWPLFGI